MEQSENLTYIRSNISLRTCRNHGISPICGELVLTRDPVAKNNFQNSDSKKFLEWSRVELDIGPVLYHEEDVYL